MKRLAYLALTAAGLFWGTGFALGKVALRQTDAVHMVLLRLLSAAVVAAPFALRNRQARALFRSPVMWLCGLLYGAAFVIQFEGLALTTVTFSSLMVGAMPALIAIGARLLGDKVSRLSWAGVAAATLGAALIAGRPAGAGTPLGAALAFGSLLLFLAWLFLLRRAPRPPDVLAAPAATMIIAALTVLPVVLVFYGPPRLDLSPVTWTAILVQGAICTFLATAAWQFGQAHVGSANAGVFINIEPLMGSIIGVALFGDHLTAALATGGALIVAGSFTVVWGERGAPLSVG